jgi:hypothetical protein
MPELHDASLPHAFDGGLREDALHRVVLLFEDIGNALDRGPILG